jgi:aryl-alcohol dehydrogenase-like predicted oxidoreductase
MEIIRPVADKHGLTLAEVALRWISHHSLMKREFGDSVIIGASSLKHIEEVRRSLLYVLSVNLCVLTVLSAVQNLVDLEKGPLRKSLFRIF